jgi:hypothetical protein
MKHPGFSDDTGEMSVRVSIKGMECAGVLGILRLRKAIRFADRLAPLRMTGLVLALFGNAGATTYYVSSSSGSDGNSGTSVSAAWQTIAHVNAQTFLPGDFVLFKRGDVWNESLAPPSSGTSGNPIAFDAYGTGAAPNLTGYYAVPSTAWVLVTGNAWKAAVPSTYTTVNFCLFGSVWGQKVSAVSSNLIAPGNFYLANGFLYVYSNGNPATFYNQTIVPMALSNIPVINVNGKTWLTFQHFLVNWFDQYGVYVQGASDHLVFANMETDSMIPQGTQPLGFYVDESAPGPGDIKLYNAEAHMNYDGFRFDGVATAITMVNDKGYGNRDGALVDNTGAVTYSFCHFYGSSLAVANSTDVEFTSGTGPTAGVGNIGVDVAPAVQVWQRYPAEVTLTVDDAGMTAGADTYYANTVLPIADAAGVPVGAAITVGYPLANTLISEFQTWINAGRDVTSHSMSHTYYTNTDALDIQYTGFGTAASLSISGDVLTITVTGAGDSVSYNLARGQPQGTILGLKQALAATGNFTTSYLTPCQGPYGTGCSAYTGAALLSQDLANVSGQDVKTSLYHLLLNVTSLTTDEITLSRQWMTTNLTGLPATPVYVYPGGYETTTMQGITAAVPYSGARGALNEDLGVKDTYADGFNAQNITSFGVNPSWMGLAPSTLNQKIDALIWKEKVWGLPWGIFWHFNSTTGAGELSSTEVTNLINDFKSGGATIQTNTGLVNWLLAGTKETGTDGNDYYTLPATSMALNFNPTKNSPVVDAGQNLGAAYELDVNGVNQNSYGSGWEIGAHVYEGYSDYGGTAGGGFFAVGTAPAVTPAWITLPQVWVNNYEGDALVSSELSLPATWVTGPAPGCTFHTPYWTGAPSSTGLQLAINDIESCRTTTGAGLIVDIPPALFTATTANGLVIPQSSPTLATSFLILRSSQDASLPNGQIVCAHGMQDNLATSTDIGLNNPDCSGSNMYYGLGPTVVSGVISGISTLGTNTTTLAAITSTGSQCVALANGYVAPGVSETVDGGANQETVLTTSAANQTGMCGTFTKTHAVGAAVSYNAGGFTLANGNVTNTSAYNDAQYMWTAESQSAANPAAVTFCNASGTLAVPTCGSNLGPDHWLIEDMNAEMYPGSTENNYVVLVSGLSGTTSPSQMPTHIHFRKDWIHGDWSSPITGANSISSALELDCIYCSVVDSQVSQIERPGAEGHGITAQGDQLKLDHNWIEGGSIGIFSGGFAGGSGPSIFGYIPFVDAEVRRNRLTYPFSWLGQSPILAGTNPKWPGQFALERKNSYENKGGGRVISAGNIRENVDDSGGQSGAFADFDVKNNSSGVGTYYQGTLHDVTSQNDLFRNSCAGVEVTTSVAGPGGGVAYPPRAIGFFNDLFYNTSGSNYGCSVNLGMQLNGGGSTWQGTVTEGATGQQASFVADCSVDDGQCPGQVASVTITGGTCVTGGALVFPTPNLVGGNQATGVVSCSSGAFAVSMTAAAANYGSGYTGTVLPTLTCTGTGCSTAGTTITVTLVSTATPVSGAIGFQAFDISVGDPVAITNCQNPAFDTVGSTLHDKTYIPSGIGPLASSGSAPWTGTFSNANVSVTYPFANTANASETSGYCKFTVLQGGPNTVLWSHNTLISSNLNTVTSADGFNNSTTDGPNFAVNNAFQNSFFVGGADGWGSNAVGTGTVAEQFNFDTANTFTADHLVWPGQTASVYTAYGLNPAYPASSPVMYFPSTAQCSGATVESSSATCVGFVGGMSATAMPLTLSDYHQFELRSDSAFYSGNAEDASDGTSMGVNIPAIDAAQTQNLFVCNTLCGSTGPYPDGPQPVVPATFFGMDFYSGAPYPTIPIGSERLWDTNTRWQNMNPSAGTYSFTNLDPFLQNAKSNGLTDVLLTLSGTPTFISSDPTNSTCEYSSSGDGYCGVPSDIAASCSNVNGLKNCDGRTDGTDQTWKNYIYALGTHVAGLSSSYQAVTAVEIWNEFTSQTGSLFPAWEGTDAQLVRLYQDANCILTGRGAACSAASMGVAAVGVLPRVQVLSSNSVVTQAPQSTGFGAYLLTSAALTNMDAAAVHTYPAGGGPVAGESEAARYATANGLMQAAGSSCSLIPCWATEFSWGTNSIQEPDPDMQAAFVARSYLVGWSSGFQRMYWYAYNANNVGTLWNANGTAGCTASAGCLSEAGIAYGTIYGWMVGKTVSCSNLSGTTWTCVLAVPGSNQVSLVLWDTSQSCSSGICGTVPVAIPAGMYGSFTALNGTITAIGTNATTVQVGAKPILLNRSGG